MAIATVTAFTVLPAAKVNEIISAVNSLLPATEAWVEYTPVWTSGGTQPVLNDGVLTGFRRTVGKTTDTVIDLTMGSTTTFGTGTYFLSLPVTAARTAVGTAYLFNSGISNAAAIAVTTSPATNVLLATTGDVTSIAPFTWGVADRMVVCITVVEP